jgi:membrane protease YdiL (CAAX protease family)
VFPFSLLPENYEAAYRIALPTIFLMLSIISSRFIRYRMYSKILFSFFAASMAINLQVASAYPRLELSPIDDLVLRMLMSTGLVVISLIILQRVSGDKPHDIFISKGNTRLGLILGLAGFIIFALVSIPLATSQFQAQDLSINRVLTWSPLLLVMVLANGVREELLYRGIFLKKYEPVFGLRCSNLLQAIIFSLSHSVAGRGNVTYTPFLIVLILQTFLLGLAWGYIMQRTDSMLGSILFHAGSDIAIFLGIFSNL